MSYRDHLSNQLKKVIAAALKIGRVQADLLAIDPAPAHTRADLALNLFDLAKTLKLGPADLAKKITAVLKKADLADIGQIKPLGPYVNLKLTNAALAKVLQEKTVKTEVGVGKRVVIEYSSPNIAKPMGVGHLRSTIIGQALANIYQACGSKVIRLNYLGDWGTQFGKLLYAHNRWGRDETGSTKYELSALKNLYVKFHQAETKNSRLSEQARKLFAQLEKGAKGPRGLWKKFRQQSLKEFAKVYRRLGVKFDYIWGESDFASLGEKAIADCLTKKICRKAEDSLLVAAENLANLPSFLLRKQDGATLYLTRDLASLKMRVAKFKPAALLYVVGQEQELHFKQLFALAQALGYLGKARAKHISFGLVLAGGKKMATRKGSLIELGELINQAIIKSKKLLLAKNPGLSQKESGRIAQTLGIGAIIYNDLRQSRQRNVAFDWNKMLNFEQGSAIYLQYTAVRINSLLKKIGKLPKSRGRAKSALFLKQPQELALARKIMFFQPAIEQAQKHDAPHILCTYLEELAQTFNAFYQELPVLRAENKQVRDARLKLVKKTGGIIAKGLDLLNIKIPSKM